MFRYKTYKSITFSFGAEDDLYLDCIQKVIFFTFLDDSVDSIVIFVFFADGFP